MADNTRIEELRRRVESDPASIAFAALAEEYRRAGQHDDAIATCKAGLRRHPAYLSAHVTLGRALIEVGQYDEARQELEHVLKLAPENLAAIRGLAEINHRLGESDASNLPPDGGSHAGQKGSAQGGIHVAQAGETRGGIHGTQAGGPAPSHPAFEPAAAIPLARTAAIDVNEPAPWEMPLVTPRPAAPPAVDSEPAAPQPVVEAAPATDPALPGLEEFLAAILRARRELEDGGGPTRS
jgi:tetratricopeptide (TPR) repeat protein